MTASQCLSVALMLASFSFEKFPLPSYVQLNVTSLANFSSFECGLTVGGIDVTYDTTSLSFGGTTNTSFECTARAVLPNDPVSTTATFELVIPPFLAVMALNRGTNGSVCDVSRAAMVLPCTIPSPIATNFTADYSIFNLPALNLDVTLGLIQDAINLLLTNHTGWCELVDDLVVPLLLNHTEDAPAVPPPLSPGLTDLRDSQLISMLINIVSGLPTLFGVLELKASIPYPNVLEVDVSLAENLPVNLPLGSSSLVASLPGGATLSLQLWFKNFACSGPFTCSVARTDGVVVQNVRLRGVGEVNRLIDNTIGPLLSSLLTDVVLSIVNATITYETKNGYEYVTIQLTPADTAARPPFALAVGLAALFSACAIAVIGYSASRHTHHPVLGPDGQKIPLRRVMIEDSFVVVTCFATMFLFAWSNSTEGAAVYMGENFPMYTFSLRSTIQDLYSSGLYALCVFITLFCGIYPYFKLLSIVLFSVILQRPQSKVLMFIDTCGKFSLLDTFMMIIMVTGLEVPGIAAVRMLASFYVFLVATFLSILVGNYATHGWRREAQAAPIIVTPNGQRAKLISPMISEGGLDRECNGEEDDESKTPQELRRWRPAIALPAAAVIIAGSMVSGFMPSLRYNLSGFATVVTGTEKQFTLFQLFDGTSWPIYATGLFTVIIAPTAYALGFPKSHMLAAWCATDALLLACVGGLLQLQQFVKFVMGPVLSPMYQATATLELPLLGLLASMLFQWALIGSEVFQVDLLACGADRVRRAYRKFVNTDSVASETLLSSGVVGKGDVEAPPINMYASTNRQSESAIQTVH